MRAKRPPTWNKQHKPLTGHWNNIGHRQIGKWKCGPGGINCSCCVKLPPNKLKPKFARYLRRKAKLTLSLNVD